MDATDYLLGYLALSLGLLPWIPASRRLARRLLPDQRGATSALASAVIGVSGVIVVAELVGICAGLRRWPFAIASALVATIVARLGHGPDRSAACDHRLPKGHADRLMPLCGAICIVAISAALLGRDANVLGTGPLDLDSLHYHLTQAAQMVQTHHINLLHHTASSDGTLYYPFDAELLDAVGMLGPHPDLAVFALNLLFGWLALLACWVIGARFGRGAPALAAGAAVLALPIVSQASSGPGLNDLPAMAFMLSAVALLATADVPRGDRRRAQWLGALSVAGLALGLSAGTKLNALPIVVLLALGVVVFATKDRWVAFFALAGPAFLTGGFWYVRDWVEVGSPVPDLNLTVAGHGFHVVPYPEVEPFAFTVAHYLGDGHVIRHWFIPGLRTVWTDLWPVIVVLILAGLAATLFADRSWLRRSVGFAVTVGFLAYLVTPTTAIGYPGAPVLFATNTRYVLPTIAVTVVLLATTPRLRRLAPALTVAFTALAIALLALASLPQEINYSYGLPFAILLALIGLGVWDAGRHLRRPGHVSLLAAVLVVGVAGAGAAIQRHYVHTRYATDSDKDRLFTYVGGLHGVRVGVAGHGLAYPFYGPTFDNAVNYIGVSEPSHAYDGPTSCPALLDVLDRVHDDYVVVEPLPIEHTERLDQWISAIPGVTTVFADSVGTVYRMPAAIAADSCQ